MTMGILEVQLVDAKGLRNTEFLVGGGIDPYVLIQYKGQEHKSKVARGQGSTPEWNQKFSFRAEYPGRGDGQYKLTLTLMDKDTFSADDYIGQTTIYLKDLLALGVENGVGELPPTKYRIVGTNKRYNGDVRVGVTFTPKVQVGANEEYGGWKNSEC